MFLASFLKNSVKTSSYLSGITCVGFNRYVFAACAIHSVITVCGTVNKQLGITIQFVVPSKT